MLNRMLFVIVLFSIWTATSIAIAQTKTPYQQISEWFDNGSGAKATDLRGAYSGRCYNGDSQTTPRGAVLIMDTKEEGLNGGPAFSPYEKLKLWLEVSDDDPIKMDKLTPADVNTLLEQKWSEMGDLVIESDYAQTVMPGRIIARNAVSVKRSQNYLVAQLYFGGLLGADYYRAQIVSNCYFFKKLK